MIILPSRSALFGSPQTSIRVYKIQAQYLPSRIHVEIVLETNTACVRQLIEQANGGHNRYKYSTNPLFVWAISDMQNSRAYNYLP